MTENLSDHQTIRAFFALQVPRSIQGLAQRIKSNLKLQIPNLRWSLIKDLHITLKFIPNLRKAHIPPLIETLSAQCQTLGSFYLELGPLELFPDSKHPRIISLGMMPANKCLRIVNALGEIALTLGYPMEERPFRGHLTLARFTINHVDENILQTIKPLVIPKIRISKLYLFESKPSHFGSSYTPIACIDLHRLR